MKRKILAAGMLLAGIIAFAGTCTIQHTSLNTFGGNKVFGGEIHNDSGADFLQHKVHVAFFNSSNQLISEQSVTPCLRSLPNGGVDYFSASDIDLGRVRAGAPGVRQPAHGRYAGQRQRVVSAGVFVTRYRHDAHGHRHVQEHRRDAAQCPRRLRCRVRQQRQRRRRRAGRVAGRPGAERERHLQHYATVTDSTVDGEPRRPARRRPARQHADPADLEHGARRDALGDGHRRPQRARPTPATATSTPTRRRPPQRRRSRSGMQYRPRARTKGIAWMRSPLLADHARSRRARTQSHLPAITRLSRGFSEGGRGGYVNQHHRRAERASSNERGMLKHPFYQAWQRGELTLEHLRGYAGQYYHHVLAFPQYVSAAHAICPDQRERQELLENLIEEERGDENHPELWLRFAEGVGATARTSSRARRCRRRHGSSTPSATPRCAAPSPRPAPRSTSTSRRCPKSRRRRSPASSSSTASSDERSLQFFEVHIGADEIHSQVGAGMVRRHTPDAARARPCSPPARECADALWGFLDGVHREYVAA